jgi:hypothetical protein
LSGRSKGLRRACSMNTGDRRALISAGRGGSSTTVQRSWARSSRRWTRRNPTQSPGSCSRRRAMGVRAAGLMARAQLRPRLRLDIATCPLWVICRHCGLHHQCLLCSRKRTFSNTVSMSAKCHKPTLYRLTRLNARSARAGRAHAQRSWNNRSNSRLYIQHVRQRERSVPLSPGAAAYRGIWKWVFSGLS